MNLIANTLFLLTLIIHTLGTPTPEDANEAITAVELTTLNLNGHAFLGATGVTLPPLPTIHSTIVLKLTKPGRKLLLRIPDSECKLHARKLPVLWELWMLVL